jgi:GTP-binding protein
MLIKEARFFVSNQDGDKCPKPDKPEYAFIGRSNVGKSSLINMLCQSSKLAKTSSTPGKTQLINHFLINNEWFLVDLPGYGYAKLSKSKRQEFMPMTINYLGTRSNLMCLFILIDSRLEPQPIDLEFMNKMAAIDMPFALIFTKIDKLRPSVLENNIQAYKKCLLEQWEELPDMFLTSAEKKTGRDDVLQFIEKVNKRWDPEF